MTSPYLYAFSEGLKEGSESQVFCVHLQIGDSVQLGAPINDTSENEYLLGWQLKKDIEPYLANISGENANSSSILMRSKRKYNNITDETEPSTSPKAKQLHHAQDQDAYDAELALSQQGFEEVLLAKDKELQMTKERAQAQKEEVVTQVTEGLKNELQCIICTELFIEAVILNCAHSFCTHCIRKWRKRKDECPVCRQKILSQTRCLALDNCIESMVKNLSPNTKARRQTLVTERKVAKPEQTSVIHDVFNESTDPNSSTDDDDDSSPSPRITPTSDNIEDLIEDYYNSEIWELNYRIY